MREMDEIYLNIITSVGTAKSCYMEAIQKAKQGNYKEAEQLIESGKQSFIEGHRYHSELIAKEANGEPLMMTLLLVHAEDQIMSAETCGILAEEFIELYQKINGRVD